MPVAMGPASPISCWSSISDDVSDEDWSFLSDEDSIHNFPDDYWSWGSLSWGTVYGERPSTKYCHDCGEVPHEIRDNQNVTQDRHMDFDGHGCAETSGVEWRNRTMNTDYDLNARDRTHVYKDFRSPRRARNRQRAEREKYYDYRTVKRGQLGKEHYQPDHFFGYTGLLAEAETTILTKRNLYEQAQEYPRPRKYHKSHRWDKGYNERRLQQMHEINRFDLDEFHYYDYDPEENPRHCSDCRFGTGVTGLLYAVDGRKRWDSDGIYACNLGNLTFGGGEEEDVSEAEISDAEAHAIESLQIHWDQWLNGSIHEDDLSEEEIRIFGLDFAEDDNTAEGDRGAPDSEQEDLPPVQAEGDELPNLGPSPLPNEDQYILIDSGREYPAEDDREFESDGENDEWNTDERDGVLVEAYDGHDNIIMDDPT